MSIQGVAWRKRNALGECIRKKGHSLYRYVKDGKVWVKCLICLKEICIDE